jgi:hypothetical protein
VTEVNNYVMDIIEPKLVSGTMVELQDVGLWCSDSDLTKLEIIVSPVGAKLMARKCG